MSPARASLTALSSCPVAGIAWRRHDGPWTLTVVCRATFVLGPGVVALAPAQQLPITKDRAHPNNDSRALYAPTDLVPFKARADVIVVGRPRSVGARVRVLVGDVDRQVLDGATSVLGPVPSKARKPGGWHAETLSDALDPAVFNFAPREQQTASMRGDERIVLEGLHPDYEELTCVLPGLRVRALAEAASTPPRRIAMRADTLWIDASRRVAALVWRGQIPLDRDLRVLVDVESGEAPAFVHEVAAPPPPVAAPALVGALPGAEGAAVSPWARGGSGVVLQRRIEPVTPVTPVTPVAPLAVEVLREPPPPEPRAREPIQLVWLDASWASRVRREPGFASAFDAIDDLPVDLEADDTEIEGDLADREDRRDIFELLAMAEPVGEEGAREALSRGVGPSGGLAEPVILVTGDLAMALAPVDTLRAVVSAVARLSVDASTAALVAQARRLLQSPGVAYAPVAATALADRIASAAFAALPDKRRQDAARELAAEVKRGLLDKRAFDRRRALGAPHVRAVLRSGDRRVEVLLPEELAKAMPRTESVRVRMLAAVHPSPVAIDEAAKTADTVPPVPVTLRPIALAMVVPSLDGPAS